MNDFIAVKVRFDPVSSNFNSIGYFFFKNNNRIDFKFVCYGPQHSRKIDFGIDDDFLHYKEKLKELQSFIFGTDNENKNQTEVFNRYINLQVKNYGGTSVFVKRITELVKTGNEGDIPSELSDFMGEWKGNFIIRVKVQELDFHEITVTMAESVSKEDFDDFFSSRKDLLDIPDIYPAIDPLEGKEINEFNLGDMFYCIIINADKKSLNDIKTAFPKYFEGDINALPIPCQLLSKEFLNQDKDMILVKTLINGVFNSKGFISRFSKVLYDPERYYKRFQRQLSENEIIDENFERLVNENGIKKNDKKNISIIKEKTKDFIVFFLITFMMLAIILVFILLFLF